MNGIAKDTISLQILDNAQYRIFYALSFVEDTMVADVLTDCQTILLVGKKHSSFLDYNSLRKDSIYNSLIKSGKDLTSILGQALTIGRQIRFNPTIIKKYPSKNDFIFQEMITSRENYRYTDGDINIEWNLFQEEKEIGKYLCKKATCSYRGRTYIAWYCPDIMLSEGPYVFGGLPGLIMEIYDSKKHYMFSLNGLEQVNGYHPIYLLADNVVISTRKEVRQVIKNLKSNPENILKLMGGRAKVNRETLQKLPPKPYNPIELE